MPHFRVKKLPPNGEEYLRIFSLTHAEGTLSFSRSSLHHFHRFLIQSGLEIHQLTLASMSAFDEDLQRHLLRLVSRKTVFYHVRRYLISLAERDIVSHDIVKTLFPTYDPEYRHHLAATLPELANEFLTILAASKKPPTVAGYRAALRAFYRLQWKREKVPYKITRADIEAFIVDLKNRGIGDNQRIARIVHIRRYLDWLYDHGRLKIHPDDLVKKHDFPKQIKTLPRPYPLDVDLEIQKRLGASEDIDYLGLLLVRRCGLRIGELCDMTLDCVQEDLNGNYFLKVPLGKLNNERVLPLDPATVEVVDKIKRFHAHRPDPKSDKVYLISTPQGTKRNRHYFGIIFQEVTQGLVIPGRISLHRLRHSYATTLLSAGLSITTLKKLLGHHDIRMTLGYAAVTQETVRTEYFAALTKIRDRYEVASFPLKTPDLKDGINRSIYDARRLIKKYVKENGTSDQQKLDRLLFRLNHLRYEISEFLKK